jgi:DnaJ domain
LDSKGYYAILRDSEDASFQEIKMAYRRLARKYHPDRNNSSFAEDMIKKIMLLLMFFTIRIRELNMTRLELTMNDLPKLMHAMLNMTTR